MRRGYKSCWLPDPKDENNIIGVNLGSDYCAEHEFGVERLRNTLGVTENENVMGIERRRVGDFQPECLFFHKTKDKAVLLVDDDYYLARIKKDIEEGKHLEKVISDELRSYGEEDLHTAWSREDLGILVKRPKNIKRLEKIHKAILDKNAAVWLGGGGGPFLNAGLCIGIIDQISEENKRQMYDADVDARNLKEASDATGIKTKADAVNEKYREEHKDSYGWDTPCGYYALSPRWVNSEEKKKTKHPVVYWLNPQDQKNNQWGWYTVEDLELWLEGKGPVKEMRKD